MIEAIIAVVWEVILYVIGFWFLKAITLGKFEDDKGSPWVSLVGVAVVIVACCLVYLVSRS